MRARAFVVVGSCLALASVLACATSTGGGDPGTGGGGGGGGGASLSDFCTTYCGKLSSCDNTRDEQTCSASCDNQLAAMFPKLRSDIVSTIETCIKAADCKTSLDGGTIATCATQAEASVAPSAVASKFCDAWAGASTKCGSSIDKATCLDESKLFNDDALNQASQCTSKACADIGGCVSATLGSFSSTGFGGPPDGGDTNEAGPPDVNTTSNDQACGQQSTQATCQTCCIGDHNAGFQTLNAAAVSCACTPQLCQYSCANELCAGQPVTTGDACSTCLNSALAGSCAAQLQNACNADPDCTSYLSCFNTYCASKP
jgi:hypothetical protein